jgi:hypothetical protein
MPKRKGVATFSLLKQFNFKLRMVLAIRQT